MMRYLLASLEAICCCNNIKAVATPTGCQPLSLQMIYYWQLCVGCMFLVKNKTFVGESASLSVRFANWVGPGPDRGLVCHAGGHERGGGGRGGGQEEAGI